MKLDDKRFWNGSKRKYYPSFAVALKGAVKFALLWTCMVSLFFVVMSFLTNDTLSWKIVLGGFLLLGCIFLLVLFRLRVTVRLYALGRGWGIAGLRNLPLLWCRMG